MPREVHGFPETGFLGTAKKGFVFLQFLASSCKYLLNLWITYCILLQIEVTLLIFSQHPNPPSSWCPYLLFVHQLAQQNYWKEAMTFRKKNSSNVTGLLGKVYQKQLDQQRPFNFDSRSCFRRFIKYKIKYKLYRISAYLIHIYTYKSKRLSS